MIQKTNNNFDQILKTSYKNIKKSTKNTQITEKEKLKNNYNIHITMLGILDYQIDKQRITKTQVTKYDSIIIVLLKKRKKLTEAIIKTITPSETIKKVIETYPCYTSFQNLYEKITQEQNKKQEEFQFITSYNIGYSLGEQEDLMYYEYRYEQTTKQLNDYIEKHKTRIRKK